MSRAWMPLYIGDYLADTQHLTAHEHGAYLLLLMHHWRCGKLPGDNEKLARIARVHPPHWPRIKKVLIQFFDVQEDGSWTQKRVLQEITKSEEISSKRKAAALQKHSKSTAKSVHLHTQPQSQSQSHKKEKKEDTADAVSPARKYAFVSGVIRLSSEDLTAWEKAFTSLDVRAELFSLAGWAASQPKWFYAVAGALAKRNREMKLRKDRPDAETDRQRRKRESVEALAQLKAFGEGRDSGDHGGTLVRFLPRTGTGGGPEDISSGSG